MNLERNRITRFVLGLAVSSSLLLAAPLSATRAATAHYQHPTYYACGGYHGSHWGYAYGYYNGVDITARLQGQDGYDGYDYGSVWYRGYYPDDEYFNFFSSEPEYYVRHYGSFEYRCFAPQVTSFSSYSAVPY